MKDRPLLKQFLATLIAAALAALGVRFGAPPEARPQPQPPVVPAPPVKPPVEPLDPLPGPAPAPPKSEPKPDAPAAIARLSFGNVGCTATVIGPRREDGRWWCLTAAHCVKAVGQRGVIRLKDGRTSEVTVAAFDRKADCCWLVTETADQVYPFAVLATASPAAGAKVWHAGYGVHVPGNREDGVVEAGPDANGQIRMRLSVSSGDSGGAICLNELNEVVSCVCCTTAKGKVAQVWGASPEAIHRAKPTVMALDGWEPIEIPIRVPDPMPAVKP